MRVAHVGAERPFTLQDKFRRVELMALLRVPPDMDEDIVNLLYGRDFLAEDQRYDAVALHSLFHTNDQISLQATVRDAAKRGPAHSLIPISPLHDLERWRKRLVETQAQHIVVFESLPMSLSGWNLGDLPGYDTKQADVRVFHYVRKED